MPKIRLTSYSFEKCAKGEPGQTIEVTAEVAQRYISTGRAVDPNAKPSRDESRIAAEAAINRGDDPDDSAAAASENGGDSQQESAPKPARKRTRRKEAAKS